MSIHIIIDGYNLIRQSASLSDLDHRDMQLARETLIERLTAYRKVKRHKITVVFDAFDAPVFSGRRDRVNNINIRFSRNGELADAVIKRMAGTEKEKALVVSSDREVADAAAAAGAAAIDSLEFERKITMATYLDGYDPDGSEEAGWTPTTRKKGPRRRLSKKQRRNSVKIQKL